MPVAAAAAVAVMALSGVAVAAGGAQPGDALWGVSTVIDANRAKSVEAAYRVDTALTTAQQALAQGRVAEARAALATVQPELNQVQDPGRRNELSRKSQNLVQSADATREGEPLVTDPTGSPSDPSKLRYRGPSTLGGRNEPKNPGRPNESGNPSSSADPSRQSELNLPANPARPLNPADSAKPVSPADPAKPARPAKPAGPTDPAEPTDPAFPGKPGGQHPGGQNPSGPTKPVRPGFPGFPGFPGGQNPGGQNPGGPARPDKPGGQDPGAQNPGGPGTGGPGTGGPTTGPGTRDPRTGRPPTGPGNGSGTGGDSRRHREQPNKPPATGTSGTTTGTAAPPACNGANANAPACARNGS
jgi:hypothetical protein